MSRAMFVQGFKQAIPEDHQERREVELGPKMGGLFVSTCPGCCRAEELLAELRPDPFALRDDEGQPIEILPDGTIRGGGVPNILTRAAPLGGDY